MVTLSGRVLSDFTGVRECVLALGVKERFDVEEERGELSRTFPR